MAVSLGKQNCSSWLSPSLSISKQGNSPERNWNFSHFYLLPISLPILFTCYWNHFTFSPSSVTLPLCLVFSLLFTLSVLSAGLWGFNDHRRDDFFRLRNKTPFFCSKQTKKAGVFRTCYAWKIILRMTFDQARAKTSRCVSFSPKKKKKKSLSNSIDSLRTVELENQKSGDRRVLPQQHWTLNVCTHFLFEFYYLQLSLLIRKCVFKMKRVCTVWKYFFPRLFIKTCKHLSKMYKIFNQVDAESQDNTAI